METLKVKTDTGFECKVDKGLADDMEFVELLEKEFSSEAAHNSKIAEYVLGDQKTALYEHLRKIYGRVSIKGLNQELMDIFAALGEAGKNC